MLVHAIRGVAAHIIIIHNIVIVSSVKTLIYNIIITSNVFHWEISYPPTESF